MVSKFKILHRDGNARVGRLETAHGVIETPHFNPVGTQASVKALSPRDLKEIGVQIILANTYHLMLRPGADLIEKFGGLHQFMGWNGPIMTDSGGFQVFSLGVALEHGDSKVLTRPTRSQASDLVGRKAGRLNKITEEGVIFQSHLDGSRHVLTPEKSIKIQHQLGADLMVAFDDHESSKHTKDEIIKSLELTERWGLRSLEEHHKRAGVNVIHPPGGLVAAPILYGVVHGGTYQDLRILSARFTDQHFDAISIGGIYGSRPKLYQIVEWVVGEVAEDKPRHLLGIGEVEDLFNGIERGIDFFDCVAPTRRARNGSLYVFSQGHDFTISIRSSKFAKDPQSIDPACQCQVCQNFSKGYLRHLYLSEEILYHQLASYHNVYFITNLMREIRQAIKDGGFARLKERWLGRVK